MNTCILNRAGQLPADGWYQIEVSGEHVNHEAKVVQVIDEKAVASIVNRFSELAKEPNFAGLLVDQDHFSLDPEKSTEAFGWGMELRNRGGQLEGRIDWTDIGEPAVKTRRFKFFSTVYDPASVEKIGERKVRNRTYAVVRPLQLDRLALTNDPNNKGGKPISNRDPGASPERSETQPTMKALYKKMGLSEDASEDAGIAAFEKITNRATTAEASLATVTAERDALLKDQVEADLDKYAPVIVNRDETRKDLIGNRALTLRVLAGIKPAVGGGEERRPITNRNTAKTPATQGGQGGGQAGSDGETDEAAKAQRITNRAHALRAQNPRSGWDAAWQQAQREDAAGTLK